MAYRFISPPSGDRITMNDGVLAVPDRPVIPFIEGDGTGPDIWRAAVRVIDAAVSKAYGGGRRICWFEVFAGEKAFHRFKEEVDDPAKAWLPDDTITAFRDFLVGIKGPLTTPVGGGIRSLNVALRHALDLYVCLRPVRWFAGVPSPVRRPDLTDMVVFRENSEDIYAGIEFQAGTREAAEFRRLVKKHFPERYAKVRFPKSSGFGLKPVSEKGTARLMRAALHHAIREHRKSVTIVHKGNIMKFTEGAFRDWAYQIARAEFGAVELDHGPWCVIPEGLPGAGIVIKDVIADAFLQQILTRPADYDVIATTNLNGDYISDALAACVGGIGIAPGGNLNCVTGHAVFEATHGTAPKYAGQDKVNPGSVILSGEMMLRHLGWNEAADLVVAGVTGAISARTVTYDFARLMDDATLLKCSEFGDAVICHM